ncbi:MAG TPA: hypothetical protein VM935_07185 [Chitinophagaceae bacterium]|jgi:RNA recognition motif-containing protein|nr:hypothetical protein [Chitinophagaceae bacterium]
MNIHVTNLSLNTIDADLRKLFATYGRIESAIIIRDKVNGRPNGTALIDMPNDVHGSQAITSLNRTMVNGKSISVSEIKYSVKDYKN